MAMTAAEFLARVDGASHDAAQRCCRCNVPIQETITGNRRIGDEVCCSDCYFAELGDLIERHPIVSPFTRRG